MDIIDPDHYTSLEDINPTVQHMDAEGAGADAADAAHTGGDGGGPPAVETEEDIDKSLSSITLAIMQDKESSDEEDGESRADNSQLDISFNLKDSTAAEEIVGPASQGPEEGFSMEATTSESTSSPHQNLQNFQDMDAIAEDEPKDIEIDYDDTWERFSQKKMIKKCDVLLPNFTYQSNDMNNSGRFVVSQLIRSHPEFFTKKKKKKNKEVCAAKSTGGGGFVASGCSAPPKVQKKEKNVVKKGKKQEEKIEGKEKNDLVYTKEIPKLTEVTIRDLQVGVERLHTNIVSFKYKQYQQFLERMKAKSEEEQNKNKSGASNEKKTADGKENQKGKAAKGKGKAKETKATAEKVKETKAKEAKTKESKPTPNKGKEKENKSRLMKKYGNLIYTSSSGGSSSSSEDEAQPSSKPKKSKPTNNNSAAANKTKAVSAASGAATTEEASKDTPAMSTQVQKTPPKESDTTDPKPDASEVSEEPPVSTEKPGKAASKTRTCSTDSKASAKKRARSRSISNDSVASIKSRDSVDKDKDERPESGEEDGVGVGEKKVVQNPLWQSGEEKKNDDECQVIREKEKEKLVEMLFSLIKSSNTADGGVNIKKEPVSTDHEGESAPVGHKPNTQEKASEDKFDSLFSGTNTGAVGVKHGEHVETSAPHKASEESILKAPSPIPDHEDDHFNNDDPLDNDDHLSTHEEETPETSDKPVMTEQEKEISKPSKQSFVKSEHFTRQKPVPTNLLRNEDMKQLHQLLLQNVWQRSMKPRTLGDLEDLIECAIQNITNDDVPSETGSRVTAELDAKLAREHKLRRRVRVNVERVHEGKRYCDMYTSAKKVYDLDSLREKVVFYWSGERKVEHLLNGLAVVKEKYVRTRSPSSSDESPQRENIPSPDQSSRKRKGQIYSDSEEELSSKPKAPVKDKFSKDPSGSSKKKDQSTDRGGKKDRPESEVSKKDKNKQHHSSSTSTSQHKTAEVQRARDENKKPRDPNKFVIPKRDKTQDSANKNSSTNMRAILEEGLRRGGYNNQTHQNKHNQQSRYHDWRKEKRIKEAKKIVDMKKIEVSSTPAPNLDSILDSMNQITKKPEKSKDKKENDSQDMSDEKKAEKKRQHEEEMRARQLREEREQERLRQQRQRQSEIHRASAEQDESISSHVELVSDDWGEPKPGQPMLSKVVAPAVKPTVNMTVKPDVRPESANRTEGKPHRSPSPAGSVPEAEANDDFDDDFDLPAPVMAVEVSAEADANNVDDNIGAGDDDYDYNDAGEDNVGDDYDADFDNSENAFVPEVKVGKVKEVEPVRSRTPSPFLSTNRYYPEFYAKKAEKEKAEKVKEKKEVKPTKAANEGDVKTETEKSKSTISDDKNIPEDRGEQKEEEQEEGSSSAIDNVKFPSDIDERIAKYFRERRSKKEKKRKSKFKDFEIDPNHSFLDAKAEDTVEDSIGSRLTGEGLGIFINKVINKLQGKPKAPPLPAEPPGPPLPGDRGSRLPSFPPAPVPHPSSCGPPQPVPPPSSFPPLPPLPSQSSGHRTASGLVPAPPPPPQEPHQRAQDDGEFSEGELEPGELVESPVHSSTLSQSAEDDDDGGSSTINVHEADIDDTMILEIVGELDDTLEEEDQLSKAKEKLAKRLLKKKALKFQKLAATGKPKPEDGARGEVDRGVSVRKRMMMTLPPKSVLEKHIDGPDETSAPPAQPPPSTLPHRLAPPGFTGGALPPPPPPNMSVPPPLGQPSPNSNQRAVPSLMDINVPPPAPARNWKSQQHGASSTDFNDDDVDSFASHWGVEQDHNNVGQDGNNSGQEYNVALSKLRGQRSQPQSMQSALEKLRNFNKRNLNDSQSDFNGQKRFRPNNSVDEEEFEPGVNERDNHMQARRKLNVWNEGSGPSFSRYDSATTNRRQQQHQPWQRTDDELAEQESQNNMWNNIGGNRRQPGFHQARTSSDGIWNRGFTPDNVRDGSFSKPRMGSSSSSWQNGNNSSWDEAHQHQEHFEGERANVEGNEQEMGVENESEECFENFDDGSLYPILLRRKITTDKERRFLDRLVAQWKQIVIREFDYCAGEFKRRLIDQRYDMQDTPGKDADLGTLYNDYRLNLKVYDKETGEESAVVLCKANGDGSSGFQCTVCNLVVTGKRNMESHLEGKKHNAKIGEYKVVEGSDQPVKRKTKSSLNMHDGSMVSQLLPSYHAAAVMGLEYIVEVWYEDRRDPLYYCLFCKFRCGINELMYHILSAQHRLLYLEKFFPSANTKFSRVKNRRFWEESTYDVLDKVVTMIEFKCKRKAPMVTDIGDEFFVDNSAFLKAAESADHARESRGLNFFSLPDPFLAYINRIPRHQISARH